MFSWRRKILFLLLFFFAIPAGTVSAHPLSPSLWELTETSSGIVAATWKTPAAKIPGEVLYPKFPAPCQKNNRTEVTRVGTYWLQRTELRCETSWITHPFSVTGISGSRGNVIFKIRLADGRHFQQVLNSDNPSFTIPERPVRSEVLKNYFPLGLHHILSGWDHLLFVMGLFLLIKPGKKLLWTVTAFTLGHSITLSLASLNLIFASSGVVEVLIALSILILALELLRDQSVKETFFHRYPWIMAFSFGLLHGLGFAGALAEVGLPMGEIPLALFCFNVGIEVGQLAFIILLWLMWKVLEFLPLPARLKRIEIQAYLIGSLAAFWFFERLSEIG